MDFTFIREMPGKACLVSSVTLGPWSVSKHFPALALGYPSHCQLEAALASAPGFPTCTPCSNSPLDPCANNSQGVSWACPGPSPGQDQEGGGNPACGNSEPRGCQEGTVPEVGAWGCPPAWELEFLSLNVGVAFYWYPCAHSSGL